MAKMKWEQIDDYHQRCKVPGGWLVKVHEEVCHNMGDSHGRLESGWDWRVSMCFLPDPSHLWVPEVTA